MKGYLLRLLKDLDAWALGRKPRRRVQGISKSDLEIEKAMKTYQRKFGTNAGVVIGYNSEDVLLESWGKIHVVKR
jgi:hypothetical protein